MVTLAIAIGAPFLAPVVLWVWYSRDSSAHDEALFGEPKFTDDRQRRAKRG
jgi:hypothetical protein